MKQRVYIETSVASYLTARPSRDLVVAAHQEITRDWWLNHRQNFQLFISELVLLEAGRGDRWAAERRLELLDKLEVIKVTERARSLAYSFIDQDLIPVKALDDALHVAIATAEGTEFLLTWNCRHIANAVVIKRLEKACLQRGFQMPVLCTPEQLVGD